MMVSPAGYIELLSGRKYPFVYLDRPDGPESPSDRTQDDKPGLSDRYPYGDQGESGCTRSESKGRRKRYRTEGRAAAFCTDQSYRSLVWTAGCIPLT